MPEKGEYYSNLKMGDNTDADCMHAKIVRKDFEKKRGEGGILLFIS